MRLTVYIFLAILLASCGRVGDQTNIKVPLHRLDRAVASYSDLLPEKQVEIIDSFRPGIMLWQSLTSQTKENIDSFMNKWSASRAVKVFSPDISKLMPSLDDTERRLGNVASQWDDLFGKSTFPAEFYTIVSPYSQSVFMADSVVLIGLNHYLGVDYPGYAGMEQYIRQRKIPNRMVPDVAEALLRSRFPYEASGEVATALSRMLYEGAITFAVMSLTGENDLADVLGYDDRSMVWLADNEERIWRKMVEADYLYSTDPDITARLVRLAPSTPLIHADAPGGAGRYTGYKIIESYMKVHPETEISELFSPAFYGSITPLLESRYNGK